MENSKSNIWTSLLPLEEDFLSRPPAPPPVWRTEITCVYEAIVATISMDLNSPLPGFSSAHIIRCCIPIEI